MRWGIGLDKIINGIGLLPYVSIFWTDKGLFGPTLDVTISFFVVEIWFYFAFGGNHV